MGDFQPTELGEKLMPIVTGVARALRDMAQASRAHLRDSAENVTSRVAGRDRIEETTEYADTAAAQAHYEALELELRGPDGFLIPTEWIDVRDTELYQALIEEQERDEDIFGTSAEESPDPELDAAIEHDAALIAQWDTENPVADGEPWEESTFPRYQIQVGLLDDTAIP